MNEESPHMAYLEKRDRLTRYLHARECRGHIYCKTEREIDTAWSADGGNRRLWLIDAEEILKFLGYNSENPVKYAIEEYERKRQKSIEARKKGA